MQKNAETKITYALGKNYTVADAQDIINAQYGIVSNNLVKNIASDSHYAEVANAFSQGELGGNEISAMENVMQQWVVSGRNSSESNPIVDAMTKNNQEQIAQTVEQNNKEMTQKINSEPLSYDALTESEKKLKDTIKETLGLDIDFAEDLGNEQGHYSRSKDNVVISRKAKNPMLDVLLHEMAHAGQKSNEWSDFVKVANKSKLMKGFLEKYNATNIDAIADIITANRWENYKERISEPEAKEEAYAYFASYVFSEIGEEQFIKDMEELANENPKEHNAIIEFLKSIIDKIRSMFGNNSVEVKNLEKLYLDAIKTRETETNTDEKQYSKQNDLEYMQYDKPITVEDIKVLRSIGRKSINDFTSEDIQKSQKWAYKFYQQLGTKSPFFRAWFGDWRAYDTSKVEISDIPSYIGNNEARKANRGNIINNDTKWDIRISREGETNTISHSGKNKFSEYGLSGIRSLVKNAILIESEIHDKHTNKMNDFVTFNHKLYALGASENGNIGLYRITVEEYFQDIKHSDVMKFHNLKYIEKVAELSADALADKARSGGSTNDNSTTNYTISDLFNFVKTYDKDFYVGKEVHPALLNEDGTPKVFYHGTRDNFTVFELQDKQKFGRVLGDGFYFTPDYDKAFKFANGLFSKGQDRGGIIMPTYLKISNPYVIEPNSDRTKWRKEYTNGNYDGIIDLKNNTYFVETSSQIKSADRQHRHIR